MLMLWEDLIPGDELKATEKAIKTFGKESWFRRTIGTKLIVDKIRIEKEYTPTHIIICFTAGFNIFIYPDGTCDKHSIDGSNYITMFEIVKLAEG